MSGKRVELQKDLPEEGLSRGARGTVVRTYLRDEPMHMVEFDARPATRYSFDDGDFEAPRSTLRYIE